MTRIHAENYFHCKVLVFDMILISNLYNHMNPGRFGRGSFRPESFRPGSFRPNLGVCRFGLGRWVDSALGRFGQRLIDR